MDVQWKMFGQMLNYWGCVVQNDVDVSFYQMYNKVKENLMSMIALYREDADLQSVIDWIQEYWVHLYAF